MFVNGANMMNGAETKSIGELQLYKVLQRANLLNYYEAFISQGKCFSLYSFFIKEANIMLNFL